MPRIRYAHARTRMTGARNNAMQPTGSPRRIRSS